MKEGFDVSQLRSLIKYYCADILCFLPVCTVTAVCDLQGYVAYSKLKALSSRGKHFLLCTLIASALFSVDY